MEEIRTLPPLSQRTIASAGFLLGELLVSLVIASVVLVALLAALFALMRGMQPQQVVIAGEALPVAPTFACFPSALRWHETFSRRVVEARAVYVLGGAHLSVAPSSAPAQQRPLAMQQLPPIADFSPGLPLDAESFYRAYAPALGPQASQSTPGDYSVAVIGEVGGRLALTCFVQVRCADAAIADGGATAQYRALEAKLWDSESGFLRYAFAEAPTRSGMVFVGALHTWMRYREGGANEEGPACVVFPDPWLFAGGADAPGEAPPFSRFTYFLPVSR